MKKYYLVHEHRHGTDIHFFQSETHEEILDDNTDKVCQQLNIDLEPHEHVQIWEVPDETKTVTL